MKKDPLELSGMHDGATPQIFKNAFRLRQNMTEPEKKVWEYLRTKPMGIKFRRQHPKSSFILDFYCHKLRLSIEIDGGYHLSKDQKETDKDRTSYLNSVGIKEIRFSNETILNDFDYFKKTIHRILERPTLQGLGRGRGGESVGND